MDFAERDRNPFFWIIVHPVSDRSKVTPAQIYRSSDYEINDYTLASEERFETLEKAAIAGRTMASRWKLEYVPDDDEILGNLETEMVGTRLEAEQFLGDIRGRAMGQLEFNNLVNEWGLRALSDEAMVELARRWRAYQERQS